MQCPDAAGIGQMTVKILEKHVKNIASSLIFAASLILASGTAVAQTEERLNIAVLDMASALLNSEVAQGVEIKVQRSMVQAMMPKGTLKDA